MELHGTQVSALRDGQQMLSSTTRRLAILSLIAASSACAETVTVRSGTNGTDTQVHFLLGPPTGGFGHTFTTADFSSAQNGPAAFIIPTNPGWAPFLSVDTLARWIGTNSNAEMSGNTALYAISFQITSAFSGASMNLNYFVDDGIGDSGNTGVYIKERRSAEIRFRAVSYYRNMRSAVASSAPCCALALTGYSLKAAMPQVQQASSSPQQSLPCRKSPTVHQQSLALICTSGIWAADADDQWHRIRHLLHRHLQQRRSQRLAPGR